MFHYQHPSPHPQPHIPLLYHFPAPPKGVRKVFSLAKFRGKPGFPDKCVKGLLSSLWLKERQQWGCSADAEQSNEYVYKLNKLHFICDCSSPGHHPVVLNVGHQSSGNPAFHYVPGSVANCFSNATSATQPPPHVPC